MFDKTATPTTPPVATQYRINRLTLSQSVSEVQVVPDFGDVQSFTFTGATNTNFVNLVNTGDHSTTTLAEKILQYLIDNGYLAATVDP